MLFFIKTKKMSNNKIFNVNEIYAAPMGEVNFKGSVMAIFIRLQGCHLRCYKKTLGCLCDTPKSLHKNISEDSPNSFEASTMDLVARCLKFKRTYNITTICLTGGDPLAFATEKEVAELLLALLSDFFVSVETSGVDFYTNRIKDLVISKSSLKFDKLGFVIDYKLPSAGIAKLESRRIFNDAEITYLNRRDWVKYVVHDLTDFKAFLASLNLFEANPINLAVGLTWNSEITYEKLFSLILNSAKDFSVLGSERLKINIQAHKMCALKDSFGVVETFENRQI
jgi:organic radical activating enzyme